MLGYITLRRVVIGQEHKRGFLDDSNTPLLDLGTTYISVFSLGEFIKPCIYDI